MSKIQTLRTNLERQKGRKAQVKKTIIDTKKDIIRNKKELKYHEQAREIIREVGLKTQEQLQYHISEITTLALAAVFPDPYELKAVFVQRRNKTECDLLLERDGMEIKPLDAAGGGVVDVAAFALRIASWSMARPKTRPVLILDEPLRYLSADLLPKASAMIKQISEDLGLQIIMVTHAEELIECADKVFRVGMKKGKSLVTEGD